MKTVFILFFMVMLLATLKSYGGFPPTTLSGQGQSLKPTTFNFKTPNNQSTQTLGTESLIETGNKNILANPSFEHSTVDSSWTNNGTEVGVVETSNIIDGKKSICFNPSSETINLVQSSTLYATAFSGGVQGLAFADIYSTIGSSFFLCSVNAGTTNLTGCVAVNGDSKWGLYKLPFILGATSNGVAIVSGTQSSNVVTTGNATGQICVDNAGVGAYDLGSAYGACITADCATEFSAKVSSADVVSGENVEFITGNCTDATTGEASCVIPSGVFSSVPNCTCSLDSNAGECSFISGSSTTTLLLFNTENSSGAGADAGFSFICQKASSDFTSSEAKKSGNTYSAQCGTNCVDEFTAFHTAGGATSAENVEWVGTCSFSTPLITCPVNTGIFTVTPNCHITNSDNAPTFVAYEKGSSSNTSLQFRQLTAASAAANRDFGFSCSKVGADFTATRLIQGTFNEMVSTKGLTKPSINSASVSASEVITENESSFVSSCTNADPSVCTLTTNFYSTDPKCWANPIVAGTIAIVTADTTGSVTIDRTDASTAFTLFCHGGR